jgi:hypothetical protein
MKLTATEGGMYEVRVNGVPVSQHTSWWKAAEQAFIRERANPADVVTVFLAQEIRVEALAEPEPAPLPAPAPIPDLLWSWDATAVAPFGIHAKPQAAGEEQRVTFVQAGGRNAVRLLTLSGDNNVNGSNDAERCDLRLGDAESDAKEGRKWRFSHGVWFPDDYMELPQSPLAGGWNWGAVLDWHDDADTPGSQGPVQLIAYPPTAVSPDRGTGLYFQIYGGAPGGKALANVPVAPIERNKWYDFEYEIGWSSTASGFCKGWLNDKQFIDYKGPTLITGHGAYLKVANYHTAHGEKSALLHSRIERRVL